MGFYHLSFLVLTFCRTVSSYTSVCWLSLIKLWWNTCMISHWCCHILKVVANCRENSCMQLSSGNVQNVNTSNFGLGLVQFFKHFLPIATFFGAFKTMHYLYWCNVLQEDPWAEREQHEKVHWWKKAVCSAPFQAGWNSEEISWRAIWKTAEGEWKGMRWNHETYCLYTACVLACVCEEGGWGREGVGGGGERNREHDSAVSTDV